MLSIKTPSSGERLPLRDACVDPDSSSPHVRASKKGPSPSFRRGFFISGLLLSLAVAVYVCVRVFGGGSPPSSSSPSSPLSSASSSAALFQVGFSVIDISPDESELNKASCLAPGSCICLGGYGSCPTCRQATGIHDPIYARAMAITDVASGKTVAILAVDMVGASNRVIDAIQAEVNAKGQVIDPDDIVVSQSHSHATPDFVGLWAKVTSEYNQTVIQRCAEAIRQALDNREDADLSVGTALYNEANNRRGWDDTDKDLVILDAVSATSGRRIGLLVNYAAHPTIYGSSNTLISRDWCGTLVDYLEDELGKETVMYVNGAQGDVTAKTSNTGGATAEERSANYGAALGKAVLSLLPETIKVTEGFQFTVQEFPQCVINQAFLAAAAVGCMDYNFFPAPDSCPQNIGPGELPTLQSNTQVAYLRLGSQLQVAIVPGETLTRMAIDGVGAPGYSSSTDSIKAQMVAPVKAIFGMSTDFLGYFVPQDEWNIPNDNKNPDNSNYEETVSLGGDQANDWMRDRVRAIIAEDNANIPV